MCGQVRSSIKLLQWPLIQALYQALRFIELRIAGWEVFYVFRDMSRVDVSYLIPHRQL
jgi:hypothetical protein